MRLDPLVFLNYARLKDFIGERLLSPAERTRVMAERKNKEKVQTPEKEESIADEIRKTWGKPGK